MSDLSRQLEEGAKSGLLVSSLENIRALLSGHPQDVEKASVAELAAAGDWASRPQRKVALSGRMGGGTIPPRPRGVTDDAYGAIA